MDRTPLTDGTYWTDKRIFSTIMSAILVLVMWCSGYTLFPAWLSTLDSIFGFLMLGISLVPLLAPIVGFISNIMKAKSVTYSFIGIFTLLAFLRFIFPLTSEYSAPFMAHFQILLVRISLCFGAYWFITM